MSKRRTHYNFAVLCASLAALQAIVVWLRWELHHEVLWFVVAAGLAFTGGAVYHGRKCLRR